MHGALILLAFKVYQEDVEGGKKRARSEKSLRGPPLPVEVSFPERRGTVVGWELTAMWQLTAP